MKPLQGIASLVLTLTAAAALAAAAWWIVSEKIDVKKPEAPAAAATVAKIVKEGDLNTVTLTEEAEKRLGLTVVAVQTKAVRRTRIYGAEVAVPIGRTFLVAAPLGGTLKAPAGGVPKAGGTVKVGTAVFQLLPLLTPDVRANLSAASADAEGIENNGRTQVELAKVALERAKRVFSQEAGSKRQVDEAQAAYDSASKLLAAASARRAILTKVVGDAETGTAAPIAIDAPENGIVRTISAMPGQTVPSGAPLFEIVDLSALWIRLPLPVHDWDDIDRTAPVQVGLLSEMVGRTPTSAEPVEAPPSANPLAGTVDLFYDLPNPNGAFTPGQRLGVTIPLRGAKESPTLPWSAIVYDIHGGTWVYEQHAPRSYVRRRVVVRATVGPDAVLASGPAVGIMVAATGVQELFGAETGFIK